MGPIQSTLLDEALKAKGADVTFKTVEGASHGGPSFDSDEVLGMVSRFFGRCLKPMGAGATAGR